MFPLLTFLLYVATLTYGVHISQLIRYYRACGSYHYFLDRGYLRKEDTVPRVPIG